MTLAADEDQLFRREVLQRRLESLLGTIRVATPLTSKILSAGCVATTFLIVLFVALASYTQREHAAGFLVPEKGLVQINAPSSGTVAEVFFHLGEHVKKGDKVASISSARITDSLGDTSSVVRSQLLFQQKQISDDLQNLERLFAQKQSALKNNVENIGGQLAQIDLQLAAQKREEAQSKEILQRVEPVLKQGYISALQFRQYQSTLNAAEAQVTLLERQRLELSQQLSEKRDELAQLPLSISDQRNDLRQKSSELERQLAENEATRGNVTIATADGYVTSVFLKAGQPINVGDAILAIAPDDSMLEAQILLPSRSIGFIKPGNEVVMRYQPFPYQKFGLNHGVVREIADSPMAPKQVADFYGQETKEPMYIVTVSLRSQTVEVYGEPAQLKPGTSVEADILLDRRRIFEWIFEPVMDLKTKS